MTTMAEVIAKVIEENLLADTPDYWPSFKAWAQEASEALEAQGYGHVPTALNDAADAIEGRASLSSYHDPSHATDAWLEAAVLVRNRAAEAGGTE